MNTIWKIGLKSGQPIQTISLPAKNRFLSLQIQAGQVVAWYSVDPNAEPNESETKLIACLPTGGGPDAGPLDSDLYLGTVQTPDGLVWHYFEERKA